MTTATHLSGNAAHLVAIEAGTALVGAIDQGTSSSRFLVFDQEGELVAGHQVKITNHYPHPGWVEHDPKELLASVVTCIDHVIAQGKRLDFTASDIISVGITNQRETCVVWDRNTGEPLHNAIVWLDTRTGIIVERLIERFGSKDAFREAVGLPISTYFSALKLIWLMENVPAVHEGCAKGTAMFGTIDSWLTWNLTGGVNGGHHLTDITNASRTMLMNLKGHWDKDICKKLGIPLNILPEIVSCSEVYGQLSMSKIKGCILGGSVGDQQAALLGQQCFTAGGAKSTYGTGCFVLYHTGDVPVVSKNGLLTTTAARLGPDSPIQYALEGSVAVAGVGLKWLKENLELIKDPRESDYLAAEVPDNGGVYLVPAFSGLLSPYWRSDARGAIVGLTLHSKKAHIVRAALEATAYQVRDVLTAMEKDSGVTLATLRVDGGMTSSHLLMQFQSDQLQVTVLRPQMQEATALGAAFAAGLAVGFWTSTEDIAVRVQQSLDSFKPLHTRKALKRNDLNYRGWKRAVTRTFDLAGPPPVLASL